MNQKIRIDQCLHGYSRGHRELASSIELDKMASERMLAYSDLLVSTGADDQRSYLTAYPLRSVQRFVFARTWLAGPDIRPGSVWTHSLILDFPALTLLDDLSIMNDLFQEPIKDNFDNYAHSIEIDQTSLPGGLLDGNRDRLRAMRALGQLYTSEPLPRITLTSKGQLDEELAIALWRQMWPAFRRRFAFVSGLSNRTIEFDADCSLQFVKSNPAELLSDRSYEDGYDALFDDLWENGPTPLRSFLARYAIEGVSPRQLVAPLAELYRIGGNGNLTERLARIGEIRELSDLPRLVRDTIVNEVINGPTEDDLIALVEVYREYPTPKGIDTALMPLSARDDVNFVRVLKASQPSDQGQLGDEIFVSIAKEAGPDLLADAAQAGIDRTRLLDVRPELWSLPSFWPSDDDMRVELIQSTGNALKISDALKLFASGIGPNLVSLLLAEKGATAKDALALLGKVSGPSLKRVARWIIGSGEIMDQLAGKTGLLSTAQVNLLCDALIENDLNGTVESHWANLIMAKCESAQELNLSALIVGYSASLRQPIRDSISLATLVFDRLLLAIKAYDQSREQGSFLEAHLPVSRYPLRNSLSLSVVEKWHGVGINMQALSISSNEGNLRDIVDHLVSKFGRAKLEAVLASKTLSPTVATRLRKIYRPKPKKKKSGWFFFDFDW